MSAAVANAAIDSAGGWAEAQSTADQNRPAVQVIDAAELGRRWSMDAAWVVEHIRPRYPDPIPHVKFGRHVRFAWGSDEINNWFERRKRGR